MRALAAAPPGGAVIVHERAWHQPTSSARRSLSPNAPTTTKPRCFAAAARAAGVPVNVIDRPAFCDFAFGAIVNRSPLVIGISTDGAAPVFGQAIRAKIETLIPKGFARWADAARNCRPRVQALALSFRGRRTSGRSSPTAPLPLPITRPVEADLEALLKPTRRQRPARSSLVGAGPGDPELLTLRAVRALQSADVILFDESVSAEILDFARREAKKMLVGKTGTDLVPSGRYQRADGIVGQSRASGGAAKGGDPMIFGRADEELAACRAAGIAIEVVPGVTAAQAAAAG